MNINNNLTHANLNYLSELSSESGFKNALNKLNFQDQESAKNIAIQFVNEI